MNPLLSKEANDTVESIRQGIKDDHIRDDEANCEALIAIIDNLQPKKSDPNSPDEPKRLIFADPKEDFEAYIANMKTYIWRLGTGLNNEHRPELCDILDELVERRRAESRIEPKQEETNLGPDFQDWLTQESKRNRELREKLESLEVKQYTEFEIRIKFETWVNTTWVHKLLGRLSNGNYFDPETDSAWNAYLQAFKDTGRFK